jgi:hypothetical protein
MATYSTALKRSENYPYSQRECPTPSMRVTQVYDGAALARLKGSALAANDVFELIKIPAGALVLTVAAKVTTVEGATCTVDIGDGATVGGYISGLNGNTSANSQSFNATTTPTFGVGKLYTEDDTIDVKLVTGTAANVVIIVSVNYIMTLPASV